MAHSDILQGLPFTAASAIGQYVCVAGDSTTENQVIPAGSVVADVLGVTIASTPTYGYPVDVVISGVVKLSVAASLGPFARVGVASLNGAIGPIVPTGAAPSGATTRVTSVGYALRGAAAGEYVSVVLDPRYLF